MLALGGTMCSLRKSRSSCLHDFTYASLQSPNLLCNVITWRTACIRRLHIFWYTYFEIILQHLTQNVMPTRAGFHVSEAWIFSMKQIKFSAPHVLKSLFVSILGDLTNSVSWISFLGENFRKFAFNLGSSCFILWIFVTILLKKLMEKTKKKIPQTQLRAWKISKTNVEKCFKKEESNTYKRANTCERCKNLSKSAKTFSTFRQKKNIWENAKISGEKIEVNQG